MSGSPPCLHALSVNIEDIPVVLIPRPQWVSWRYERRHSQWTKLPKNPDTGKNARTDDPATWGAFEHALRSCQHHRMAGVGFVFSTDDPFAGIDLDRFARLWAGDVSGYASHSEDDALSAP